MRDATGRQPASFLDDGLTTATHQRIPHRPRAPMRLGDVRSPRPRHTRDKETSYVAVHSFE
jgi:hypothetical protein